MRILKPVFTIFGKTLKIASILAHNWFSVKVSSHHFILLVTFDTCKFFNLPPLSCIHANAHWARLRLRALTFLHISDIDMYFFRFVLRCPRSWEWSRDQRIRCSKPRSFRDLESPPKRLPTRDANIRTRRLGTHREIKFSRYFNLQITS